MKRRSIIADLLISLGVLTGAAWITPQENVVQTKEKTTMTTVSVRYIVNNVDAAISFYTNHLGFSIDSHPGPGFAVLSRGNLRLLLNVPGAGGAGQAMPDGRKPEPLDTSQKALKISGTNYSDDLFMFINMFSLKGATTPSRLTS